MEPTADTFDDGAADAPGDVRSRLVQRLRTPSMAWSVSGRDVGLVTSFDHELEIGGFAVVTPAGQEPLLVQIHELGLAEREAVHVDVATDGFDPAGAVQSAQVGVNVRYVTGRGEALASVGANGLGPVTPRGFTEAAITPAPADAIAALIERSIGSGAGLRVGTGAAEAEAQLKATGFSRHTFLVGQSGSGKTYTLGVILERLLVHTSLPMVIIDPNSDSVHLGQMLPRERVRGRGLPAMDEARYAVLAEAMERSGPVKVARSSGGDLPLAIHLSDLAIDEQTLVLGLDQREDADELAAYVDVADELASEGHFGLDRMIARLEERGDDAARRLLRRIHNRRLASWQIWAANDAPSLASLVHDVRAVILDTGSLDDPRQRSVVALAALGTLHRRAHRRSVLLVIDEAHNLLAPTAGDPFADAVAEHGAWVAAEGRKYGVHMLISTQRPQKIRRNVLSQCDNLILMRMNSKADIDELSTVFSHVPAAMVAEATSFRQGEMLMAGPIAPTPLRVQVAERWCPEGGADLPTDWANTGALATDALN